MASYTGGSKAASRIQALQAQRKTQQEQLNQRKQQIVTASSKTVSNSFQSRSSTHQDLLHTDTVGLVTHTDFKARRKLMHSADAAPSEQPPTSSPVKPSKRPPFKRAVLSFAGGSDDSDDSDDSDGTHSNDNAIHRQRNVNVCPPKKRRRLGKDPDVDSSFLPDRDRELAEDKERERLKQDWLRKQDAIKNETVRITYSFWDGTGHRKLISCKKGTTIAHFLTIVQTQVKQLRNTTADSLMFIKEDLIIPHHYSFYDFIVSKARGKSGPLFNFDVVEDVRLLADASKEKEDAHAAKVVERRWYERNRHIFPASRWEVYDPTKKFDKYTIHGH